MNEMSFSIYICKVAKLIFQRTGIVYSWILGDLIEAYSLRTRMFDHVARVLHMVDSQGTDWLREGSIHFSTATLWIFNLQLRLRRVPRPSNVIIGLVHFK